VGKQHLDFLALSARLLEGLGVGQSADTIIFAPLKGYDEPEILPSSTRKICLIGADAGH
jgi:hypothetical protein